MYRTAEKPNSFPRLKEHAWGWDEFQPSCLLYIWQNLCLGLAREQWLHFTYEQSRNILWNSGICENLTQNSRLLAKAFAEECLGESQALAWFDSQWGVKATKCACPSKWVCVCFLAYSTSYHWITKKGPESRLSGIFWMVLLPMEKYLLATLSVHLSPVVSLSMKSLLTEFC